MSNPYTFFPSQLNLNTAHWDWLTDHEHQMTDHESLDVDIDSAFDDISAANELAKYDHQSK
jgi:hypothetical protein